MAKELKSVKAGSLLSFGDSDQGPDPPPRLRATSMPRKPPPPPVPKKQKLKPPVRETAKEMESANAGFPLSSDDSDQRPDPPQLHATGVPPKPSPPPAPSQKSKTPPTDPPKVKPHAYEAFPPKPPTYRTYKAPLPNLPHEESVEESKDDLSAQSDRDASRKAPAAHTLAASSEEWKGAQKSPPNPPIGVPALNNTEEDSTSKKIDPPNSRKTMIYSPTKTIRHLYSPPPQEPTPQLQQQQKFKGVERIVGKTTFASHQLAAVFQQKRPPQVATATDMEVQIAQSGLSKPAEFSSTPYLPPPQVPRTQPQQQPQHQQRSKVKEVKRIFEKASHQLPGVLQWKRLPRAASTTDDIIGPSKPAEFPFSAELQQDRCVTDFISICKKIHHRLLLICEYYKKDTISKEELVATYQQMENKEVSISVFGRHNTGKSSLLNALAGDRFLPMKFTSETSFKVKVFHENEVHQALCEMVSDPSCGDWKHAQCPKLCEVRRGSAVKVANGAENISSYLKELNSEVRNKKKAVDSLPEFELYVNVPVLGGVPQGWKVCLVDNPGFGEATQHIAQLAERAMKISSAYIYLLTSKSIGDTVDADAFKNLAERDREAFNDGRFVAVVTHFDQHYGGMAEEEAKEDEVKNIVCVKIADATKSEDGQELCIDEGSVVAISGSWALTARLMQKMGPKHPEYSNKFDYATQALKRYPYLDFPRGQGETLEDYLKQHPEKASEMLLDASGLKALQKKIEVVTKSCVMVWAKKMSSDYSTFIRRTKETLCTKQTCVWGEKKANTAKYETDLALHTSIESDIKALELPSNPESSPVWQAINEAYPTDIETSDLHGIGEKTIKKLVERFKEKTKDDIEKKQLSHNSFLTSLSRFLGEASDKFEKKFNQKCAFTGAHNALRKYSKELVKNIGTIQSKGNELLKRSSMYIQHEFEESHVVTENPKFEPPNLAEVKEIVKIPPVSLSLFDKVKLLFKNLFKEQTYDQELQAEIKQKEATLKYQSWTKDHEEMMDLLQKSLAEQCRSYFEEIRPKIVKYFFKEYKEEVKQECKRLTSLKTQLQNKKEQIDQLHVEIERQGREITALEDTIKHMALLEAVLKEKTEVYTHL